MTVFLLHMREHFVAPECLEVAEFTWGALAFMITLDVIAQICRLAEGLCTLVTKVPKVKTKDNKQTSSLILNCLALARIRLTGQNFLSSGR